MEEVLEVLAMIYRGGEQLYERVKSGRDMVLFYAQRSVIEIVGND